MCLNTSGKGKLHSELYNTEVVHKTLCCVNLPWRSNIWHRKPTDIMISLLLLVWQGNWNRFDVIQTSKTGKILTFQLSTLIMWKLRVSNLPQVAPVYSVRYFLSVVIIMFNFPSKAVHLSELMSNYFFLSQVIFYILKVPMLSQFILWQFNLLGRWGFLWSTHSPFLQLCHDVLFLAN